MCGDNRSKVTRNSAFGLCLVMLLQAGCTETIRFQSFPRGAQVYVDETYIGSTPTDYNTKVVQERKYRVVNPKNDETATGVLTTRVCPGRVVGSIFTLGILSAFKSLRCYREYEITVDLTNAPPTPDKLAGHSDAKIYDVKRGSVRTGMCDKSGRCTIEDCTGEIVRQPAGSRDTRDVAAAGAAAVQAQNAYGNRSGSAQGAHAEGASSVDTSVALTVPGVGVFQCQDGILECRLSVAVVDGGGAGACNGDKYRITIVPR